MPNMVAPLSRSNSFAGSLPIAALDQASQSHTDLAQFGESNGMVVAESPRSDATTSQVSLNVSIEIWTNILARCLPKEMGNFSLASRFFHVIYIETLRTLFRPHTGTVEEIVEFLASEAFKSAFAGNKVFLPNGFAFNSFQALFSKNMRLDKSCHGDLLQTGRLLLNFDYLYSERKLKSLMDIGICTLSDRDPLPDSNAFADIDPSTILHEKQWDFIVGEIPALMARRQKLYIKLFMEIPLEALDAGIYKSADNYKPDWLKAFLKAGIKINDPDSERYKQLLKRVNNHIEILQLLMKLGVNQNTALLTALKENHPFPIIELLLNHEANPNITDEDGNTPLHIAFSKRYPLAIMQLLVQKGADPNVLDKAGKTLLQHLVVMSNFEIGLYWRKSCPSIAAAWKISYSAAEIPAEKFRIALIKCLLEGGENKADPNIQGKDGADTPLLIALKKGLSFPIIELLLNHGADPNITDEDGNTLLHIAFSKRYPLAVMQLLMQKGADPNARDKARKTLLQRLVVMSSFEIGLYWKESCPFIASAWKISYSAAEIPAEKFRIALMKCLLEGGENKADPNIQGKDGNAPLQIAFREKRSFDVMQLLMQKGADPNALDKAGKTLLQHLVVMSNFEIDLHWKKSYPSIAAAWKINHSAAEIPAEKFRIALIKCLLEGGENKADPNIQGKDGADTPLLIALKKGLPFPIIELLLNHGANPNITDEGKNAPLQIAFREKCSFDVMQLLMQKGADPNARDKAGKTLLQRLVVMSSFEIGLYWKESCPSIAAAWKINHSAAEIPAEKFRIALIKSLLQHKPNHEDIKDTQGRTVRTAWHILLKGLQPPINSDIDSDLFDKFMQYFGNGNFNPLRSKEDRTILQLAKRAGHNEMITFLRDEIQNTVKHEVEAKYSRRLAWLGRLFNGFQIWRFGL